MSCGRSFFFFLKRNSSLIKSSHWISRDIQSIITDTMRVWEVAFRTIDFHATHSKPPRNFEGNGCLIEILALPLVSWHRRWLDMFDRTDFNFNMNSETCGYHYQLFPSRLQNWRSLFIHIEDKFGIWKYFFTNGKTIKNDDSSFRVWFCRVWFAG